MVTLNGEHTMTKPGSYQLETTRDTATLYLFRSLERADVPALTTLCAGLPRDIRTLRVDMQTVAWLEGDGMETLRALLRHWRASRRGEFRLSFRSANLSATYTQGTPPAMSLDLRRTGDAGTYSESMTAAFL